jgi:hypothetical protein
MVQAESLAARLLLAKAVCALLGRSTLRISKMRGEVNGLNGVRYTDLLT